MGNSGQAVPVPARPLSTALASWLLVINCGNFVFRSFQIRILKVSYFKFQFDISLRFVNLGFFFTIIFRQTQQSVLSPA